MNKVMKYTLTALFVSTLTLAGTAVTTLNATQQADPAVEQAAATEQVLRGTIDANSQLIDEKGEVFNLANNDKGMEVKSMSGMKVEIKGTVMEKEGQKVVEVIEYNILK